MNFFFFFWINLSCS